MMKIFAKQNVRYGLFVIIGLFLGWLFFHSSPTENNKTHSAEEHKTEIWTCSMHPQIRMDKPGKCPICGMDLILLNQNATVGMDPDAIYFTKEAAQLANVMTSVVSKQQSVKEVRLFGKVQADERLLQSQVAYIPGRIEKLYINFTGESVRKGQILALIYSPDLITAQQELLETVKTKEAYPEIYEAAKEKLMHWKLSSNQIAKIESSKKVKSNVEIYATASGVVTAKLVNVGDYVGQGTVLFEVSDLSRIWVQFDAYESDLHFIKKGNQMEFTIQAIPGTTFNEIISFIDPVIDPINRVAKIRIEMNNKDGKLKPEMFATGFVKANLDQYENKMVIPKTAVMWTGKRSVVYVKQPGEDPIFKIREIEVGPMLGNSYVVEKGLSEGEEIVTEGAFSVDAAAQLEGKPSMMNPESTIAKTENSQSEKTTAVQNAKATLSPKAKEALKPLYQEYLNLKDGLAADNLANAKKAGMAMQKSLSNVNMSLFTGNSHEIWMKHQNNLKLALQPMANFKTIEEVRKAFQPVSETMIALTNSFKPFGQTLYVQHCPMVDNNKGANWLSQFEEIKNPYFGKSMLTCGETKSIIQ